MRLISSFDNPEKLLAGIGSLPSVAASINSSHIMVGVMNIPDAEDSVYPGIPQQMKSAKNDAFVCVSAFLS
jgi:hypothetical protein